MKNKILKIIQIVYDIISLGFIIFISIALAVAPKVDGQVSNNDSPSTLVYETKDKKNAIKGEGRSLSMTCDFLSSDFLYTIMSTSQVVNDYINDNSKTTKTIIVGEGYNNGVPTYPRVTKYSNVNYNDLTITGTEDIDWSYLYDIQVRVVGSSSDTQRKALDVFYYFRNDLEDVIFTIGTSMFLVGDYLTEDNYSISFYQITYNQQSIVGTYPTIVYSNNHMFDSLVNAMSNNDYTKGYELGKEAGYQLGFVAGSNSLDYNVFNIMGQAFGSLANIFSIELLPGFPLWILVFAPLIVAVVIVVVKMIKG